MPEPVDPPIIITGGSVTLKFNSQQLPRNSQGNHYNPDKRLKRITIKGDGLDITQDFATGQGVTIMIHYENGNKP
ncbi:MAG TPA: hypothetical protein VF668_17655 [Pyrinomonadaceae bacterium]|jgi:hypothetical protein